MVLWSTRSDLSSAEREYGSVTRFLLGREVAHISPLFIMMISFVEGKKVSLTLLFPPPSLVNVPDLNQYISYLYDIYMREISERMHSVKPYPTVPFAIGKS